MTKIYVGTAGWSYLKWDKEFYPKDMPPREKLAFYASRFNAVELNNSFYHLPTTAQFRAWEGAAPKDFTFAIKAPRYITHMKRLKDPATSLKPFLKAVGAVTKPGPLFFQLPPVFPKDLDRLEAFLKALPRDTRCVIELRDTRWHDEVVFKMLRKYKTAFCLFDTPEGVSPRVLTTDFTYIRLRGRGGSPKTFLKGWANFASDHSKRAFVFFDNREEKKFAFGNALLFRSLTEGLR